MDTVHESQAYRPFSHYHQTLTLLRFHRALKNRKYRLLYSARYPGYRGRNELDLDVLYRQGLADRDNSARYDLSWQFRLSPPEYPKWGLPTQWYLVTELGGRWRQSSDTTHQFTLGLQRVAKRWVFEAGVIQDLNHPDHTRFLFSIRYH